ncbi:MAG: DUF2155 domain-containing protein [Methylocystis sp.]|nr:DUF2155 domain-containing protein [Methylocystis sp.]MBI3275846.1 DUF2155 domain-containing protein [Methylocystis sp.]
MTTLRFSRLFASWRPAVAGLAASCFASAAPADPIRHPIAVFAGLDKITGRIMNFEVAIDETVQFGSLQVTPRVCNTRPQTEAPQTTGFVEVDEQDAAKNEAQRIFSGWMFAASPGLHGVEHPVYDVWLTDCKGGAEIAAQAPESGAAPTPTPAPETKKHGSRSRKVEPVEPAPIEAAPIGPRDSVDALRGAAPADGAVPGGDKPATPRQKPRKPLAAPLFPF